MGDAVWDVIVIGGGAAGVFGALACAEDLPGGRILILERGEALLRKVKISGGGRCNVTHAAFDPQELVTHYPRGARALRGPFTRFQPLDTMEWFQRRGAALKTEPDGRVFPVSDHSQTIINTLLDEVGKLRIAIQTRSGVERITQDGEGFSLTTRDGRSLPARRVLLATGGERGGFALAQSLGHRIVAPVPSLFTFNVRDARLEGLAGLAVQDALVRLPEFGLEQRGPVLVTHWGLSGPAVLKLSAWGARDLHRADYHALLRINWAGAESVDRLYEELLGWKDSNPRQAASAHVPAGRLPARLWKRLTATVGIRAGMAWNECPNAQIYALAGQVARGEFSIVGKGAFKDEFVTSGGVDLDEVNFKTMQSRVAPGLHLAGEVLDIDGVTGGFNFQSAWTTGWIAGKALARDLRLGKIENRPGI
jgi:predicted Rossmann fold flavoprotein